MSTSVDIQLDEKIEKQVSEPTKYKVIFLNDDVTPIDWVIDLLVAVFRHSQSTAKDLTLSIHEEGSAVVGIYTYEIAEQKLVEATTASRNQGFPLSIKMEKE